MDAQWGSVMTDSALSLMVLLGIVVPALAVITGWWLTGRFRRYALENRVVDVPNDRSSHAVVTPRGGGVAIAISSVAIMVLLGVFGLLPSSLLLALIGGGVVIVVIGLADDHRHVPVSWRLLAHFAAAGWLLAWLGGWPGSISESAFDIGWLGYGAAALYVVWVVNLTNFMDGIDALAGVETISVCVAGAFLFHVAAPGEPHWIVPLILAGATLGFLVWNLPPAKIFMGDAGSGFLGMMLAALSLQAGLVAPRLFCSWLILLGVFVVDATTTLLRRIARREKFYEAHRSHAYQFAAQRWGAHGPVTFVIAAINVCWLFPLALLVALRSLDGLVGLFIAYVPLIAAALWLRAGAPSSAYLYKGNDPLRSVSPTR
jgi:Fuc2NAc and GlcNAc transferase